MPKSGTLRNRVEETNMFGFLDKIDRKQIGVFAAGILFGTAGIKILSGRDAKKYIHTARLPRSGQRISA